ncbi:uncharacterized protein LOC131007174 isoform X1 [Salvia miltiorrhiza]|uniref:uncharacterized protein LOC131007174 isoform X1 n=1 Tax=Salvia miltiorrhiza TaxID=226208 RepID=UPI0025AC1CF8|nr:uncharacterized protein LOC131007174 isoform X1 [Salvia miltiorrhiza]XP_057790327.1 uncharacterized protein LOC131007174 isoform X1 [Salvia miltiorrhiza]
MLAKENEMRKQGDSDCSSDSGSGAQAMTLALKPKHPPSSSSKVFSDEDSITLLKSLAVFWASGRNNKWADFHRIVKDKLSKPDFTRVQISEKVRSLNKKYKTNWQRGRVPDNPHELVVYELSKPLWEDEMNQESGKVWEDEMNQESGKGMKKNKKRKRERNPTLDEFRSSYPNLYASFNMFGFPKIARKRCVLLGREKAQKLENEWKQLTEELHCLEGKRLALSTKPTGDNSEEG